MKEYIERETILKTPPFTKCVSDLSEYAEGYLDCVEDACEAVKKTPAADVAPVVHGEWLTDERTHRYHCSVCQASKPYDVTIECGKQYIDYWECNHCPNCGARMNGGTV